MSGFKRNVLSYQQKREIIKELESGVKNVDVCRKFGLPSSSVATIWRFRHKILAMEDLVSPNTKRARMCKKVDVDQAMYEWVKSVRAEGIHLSVSLIKAQAEKIAADLGHQNFQCSNGWLYRFRQRHAISLGKPRNQVTDNRLTPEEEWLKMVWENVLKEQYGTQDVYCAHEVGLFYNATPSMTKEFSREKCAEGQLSDCRLTVLLCCNMDGSDKRPLVVVGRAPVPDFSGMIGLPVTYVSHRTAWMTTDIFERELFLWDEELRSANKKILLMVNTSSAHVRLNSLESIHLCFFPREAPGLQPVNKGISRELRTIYRRHVVDKFAHDLKADRTLHITILEALRLISYSWDKVTPEVITESFGTAGYLAMDGCREPLRHLSLSERLAEENKSLIIEDLDSYEFIDDHLATNPPDDLLTADEQLVAEVEFPVEEPADSSETKVESQSANLDAANDALATLKSFFAERSDAPEVSLALDVLKRNLEELNKSSNC